MSLSKTEQIALFVVVFLVIAVAGGILFIKPQYDKIDENRKILEARKQELVNLEAELGLPKFEELEKKILEAYEDGRGASEVFYEGEMTTYEADRLVREVLRGAGVSTDNLIVNPLTTHNLMLSIFRELDISYPIKDMAIIGQVGDIPSDGNAADNSVAADDGENEDGEADESSVNADNAIAAAQDAAAQVSDALGSYIDEEDAELAAMMAFMMFAPRNQAIDFFEENITNQARAASVVAAMREFLANESETVAMQSVRFEIPMTKAEAFNLSMHVYNLEDASYIVNMTNKDFDDENEGGAGFRRVYTVDLMFFIVEPMEQPDFDYATKFKWDIETIE